MDLFLLDAISLDTDLVSNYKQVVELADQLFEEVSAVAKTTNKYRSKEALKLILINLFKGYRRGKAVRYSRDKRFYASGTRYHQIWFKYDRVIPIIDALKELSYADYKDGLHFPDDDVLYQSRIWASQKLIDLFHQYHFQIITHFKEKPPRELIELRASKKDGGHRIDYQDDHRTETMRANLTRYNKFIEEQEIEVRLPPDAEVSWYFLESRKGNILSQRIEITRLYTDNDWFLAVDDIEYHGYEIEGMRFLIETGTFTDSVNKYISNNQITINNYNTYYTIFINYVLNKLYYNNTISNITNTSTTPTPNTIPMTQSFFDKSPQIQSLTLPISTTIEGSEEYSRKRPFAYYGIRRLDFKCNCQRLYRVFNEHLDQGGRFYGAVHLDLPRELRPFIFINNQPTIELDYGAHHVRMLYHLRDIPYDKDPYEELCDQPEERPIFKKIVLVSINAEDEKEAIKAISDELRKDGFSGECVTHKYLEECISRFKEVHHPIAGAFFNRYTGLWLQYDDSRIIDEILMMMVSKNIPALPVHDSIIAPAEHEETIRDVMTEAYQKIMGKGFLPIIK